MRNWEWDVEGGKTCENEKKNMNYEEKEKGKNSENEKNNERQPVRER